MTILEREPVWKCDLCGKAEMQSTAQGQNWVHILVMDDFYDRDFHDKIICSQCTEEIINIINKRK